MDQDENNLRLALASMQSTQSPSDPPMQVDAEVHSIIEHETLEPALAYDFNAPLDSIILSETPDLNGETNDVWLNRYTELLQDSAQQTEEQEAYNATELLALLENTFDEDESRNNSLMSLPATREVRSPQPMHYESLYLQQNGQNQVSCGQSSHALQQQTGQPDLEVRLYRGVSSANETGSVDLVYDYEVTNWADAFQPVSVAPISIPLRPAPTTANNKKPDNSHKCPERQKSCFPCQDKKWTCVRLPNGLCTECVVRQRTIEALNAAGKSGVVFPAAICCVPDATDEYKDFLVLRATETGRAKAFGGGTWRARTEKRQAEKDRGERENIGRVYNRGEDLVPGEPLPKRKRVKVEEKGKGKE
ncbi:hypothetical protein LTS08_004488 [Lithohypha guttulata]|nr:hypothetical protein LTS08_004488 [Lithohypha guttulata]